MIMTWLHYLHRTLHISTTAITKLIHRPIRITFEVLSERIMPIHDIYLVTLIHLYLFKIDIFTEFHVLGVDSENLQTTNSIRNTNVYFSVKSTESSQGCVYAVRSVCSGHYNNMSSLLEAIHKC